MLMNRLYRLHWRWLLACGLGLMLAAACSPAPAATPTPAPPTSRFATVEGPFTRQTLPPTWTPSVTPSASPTPTVTPTPSPVPTESADSICEGFRLLHDFSGQRTYRWGSYIPILFELRSPDAFVRFTATHRASQEGTGFELPGGQAASVEFQISALPRPGTYDWTLSVVSPAHGEICQQQGSFTALVPTITPAATPSPETTPEATEKATAEITEAVTAEATDAP